jgi:hypothetical protein
MSFILSHFHFVSSITMWVNLQHRCYSYVSTPMMFCAYIIYRCWKSSYQWMWWCNGRSWRSRRKRWGRRDISIAANIITIAAIITTATVVWLLMLMCWFLHGQVLSCFCQWWCWWLCEILCPTLVPWSSAGSCLNTHHYMLYVGLSPLATKVSSWSYSDG